MPDPPIVERESFTVVGLSYHGTNQEGEISALWEQTADYEDALGSLALDDDAYGVSYGGDPETGEFDYVAGVRADPDADVPDDMEAVSMPAATYAVFTTTLSDIQETMAWVHGEWLPDSGYEMALGPEFERYDSAFDPRDPDADFEIFVPIDR